MVWQHVALQMYTFLSVQILENIPLKNGNQNSLRNFGFDNTKILLPLCGQIAFTAFLLYL